MALSMTVGGVSVTPTRLSIAAVQNGIDRCVAEFVQAIGDAPAIDDAVVVTEDGSTLYGGSVKVPRLYAQQGDVTEDAASLSALDYNELLDRAVVFMTIASGTNLKAAATLLMNAMNAGLPAGLQVSIDAAWVADGPDIDEDLVYEDVKYRVAFDDLSARSGWLYNVGYDRNLLYFDPASATAAPWDVTDGDGNTVGDIEVQEDRLDYANQIVVRYSDAARQAYAFLKATGNFGDTETVTIGSKTYEFQAVLTDVDGHVLIGGDATESLGNLVAAITLGSGSGTTYAASTSEHGSVTALMQSATHMKCVALAAGAGGNSISVAETAANAAWVTEGDVGTGNLTFGLDAGLRNREVYPDPAVQSAEQAAYGIYSKVVGASNIYDSASAVTLATQALAVAVVVQKTVRYRTRRAGLFPGMAQSITCAARGLGSSYLITEIQHQLLFNETIERTVTAISGVIYKGSKWRETYQTWSGKSTTPQYLGAASGGVVGRSGRVYALGLSKGRFVSPAATTWTEISGIPFIAPESFTGRVRAWVREKGGATVSIRLEVSADNVTWTSAVALSDVASATLTLRTATLTIEQDKYYRLAVYCASAGKDVEALCYVEEV